MATTNAILVQQWVKKSILPEINLPRQTVREILRIKKIPRGLRFDAHSISFLYEDESWLKSHLLATDWPNLSAVLKPEGNEELKGLPSDFL